MADRTIVVVGAGPGVSGSVARLFAQDDYDVGLFGMDTSVLAGLSTDVEAAGGRAVSVSIDITDTEAFAAGMRAMGQDLGWIDVLHFNPSAFRHKDPLALTVEELLQDVGLGVGALLTAVQAARPFMSRGARVTVTGSEAADKPWNEAASLGVQKAAVRNLVISLDRTLAPDGIRAVSVTIRGTLAKEGPFSPPRVAEAIKAAAEQDEAQWRTEVPYDG